MIDLIDFSLHRQTERQRDRQTDRDRDRDRDTEEKIRNRSGPFRLVCIAERNAGIYYYSTVLVMDASASLSSS